MTNLLHPRLLEDPSVSAELRGDLEEERLRVSNYDAAAGLAALSATIGAGAGLGAGGGLGAGAGAGAASPTGGLAAPLAKAGMSVTAKVMAALVVVSAGSYVGIKLGEDAAASERARGAQVADAAPRLPSSEPSVDAQTVVEAGEVSRESAARAKDAASGVRRLQRAADPLHAEIESLAKIKRALPGRPDLAYRMAQAAHARFGEGMFFQEREALSVIALVDMGRLAEARSRGRLFLRRFPESPLAGRVRTALASVDQEYRE